MTTDLKEERETKMTTYFREDINKLMMESYDQGVADGITIATELQKAIKEKFDSMTLDEIYEMMRRAYPEVWNSK